MQGILFSHLGKNLGFFLPMSRKISCDFQLKSLAAVENAKNTL
jgi:hypothetical protein